MEMRWVLLLQHKSTLVVPDCGRVASSMYISGINGADGPVW